MALPKGWTQASVGELLSKQQIKEIKQMVKKGQLEHKRLVSVIKKDTTKLHGKVIPEYLAYALEFKLKKGSL